MKTLPINTIVFFICILFAVNIGCKKDEKKPEKPEVINCDISQYPLKISSVICNHTDSLIPPTYCILEKVEVLDKCLTELTAWVDMNSSTCAYVIIRKRSDRSVFDTLYHIKPAFPLVPKDSFFIYRDDMVNNDIFKYTYKLLEIFDSSTITCVSNQRGT